MNKIILGSFIISLIFSSCTETADKHAKVSVEPNPIEESIVYQIMVQRATQGAIWAMPGVGLVDFIKATRRDLGGDYGDVLYLTEPFDSKHGFLTANDVTAYAWSNITIANGPIVVDVPAASDKVSYFGSFVNAWFQPIEDVGPAGADKGKGGKYLLVADTYDGEIPEGYIVLKFDTYDIGFAFRPRLYNDATDADAAEYAQTLKIYSLADAANPPATKYIHVNPKAFSSLPTYDHTFFEDIDHLIQSNPVRTQDKVMVTLLEDLGIVKGQTFNPTEIQKKAIKEGTELAWETLQNNFFTPGKTMVPLWKGKTQWQVWKFREGQPQLGFPFESDEKIFIDDRASLFFFITYLPKYLGGGTFYLNGLRDSDSELFNGTDTYKLNVPKDTPANDFWSAIVYSNKTKGFIKNAPRLGLSSRNMDTMIANDDGSYDIYFGPNPPKGMEANCIPTGEDFFLLFRLYGPESKDFYKTWMLGDVEKLK